MWFKNVVYLIYSAHKGFTQNTQKNFGQKSTFFYKILIYNKIIFEKFFQIQPVVVVVAKNAP